MTSKTKTLNVDVYNISFPDNDAVMLLKYRFLHTQL